MLKSAFAGACFVLLAATSPAAPQFGSWGVDLRDQDRSIRPGDDFASYQNGGWFARTELTPTLRNTAHWRDVRVRAANQVSSILEGLARGDTVPADPALAKAAAFYRAAMNGMQAEARGLAPLRPALEAIRAAQTKSDLAHLIGRIEGPGTLRMPSVRIAPGRGIFHVDIDQDRATPGRSAVYLGQGGLMLPGPEYYSDPALADIKRAYEAHIATMLRLIGWDEPAERAAQIVSLESQVATVSSSHEQLNDANRTYNPMRVSTLIRSAPGFDWRAYLAGARLGKVDRVVIDAPKAFAGIAKIFADAPLQVLQARQAFATTEIDAPRLNGALHDAAADFQPKVQQGLQASPSRAFEAEKWLEAGMPDALSQLYVARFSSPRIKAGAEAMASRMKIALDARLARNPWMSAGARTKARAKLAMMRFHVGWPEKLDSYEGLDIREDDFFGDIDRLAASAWQAKIRQLDRPFDRSRWMLTAIYPQYGYSVSTNTVEIPAALLQPPFFDPAADDAVNYGAIGTVIGAMIIQAFGPTGINYDGKGRLHPWLSKDDAARYKALGSKLGERYSREEPLPNIHIKGMLVLDEAIGDIGALQIAIDAYHASLAGRLAPVVDGYSGDQRFFMARAQMWRAKFAPEFLRNQLATGSNAPPICGSMDPWHRLMTGMLPSAWCRATGYI